MDIKNFLVSTFSGPSLITWPTPQHERCTNRSGRPEKLPAWCKNASFSKRFLKKLDTFANLFVAVRVSYNKVQMFPLDFYLYLMNLTNNSSKIWIYNLKLLRTAFNLDDFDMGDLAKKKPSRDVKAVCLQSGGDTVILTGWLIAPSGKDGHRTVHSTNTSGAGKKYCSVTSLLFEIAGATSVSIALMTCYLKISP